MMRADFAMVVDDKSAPRKWGVKTLLDCGFSTDKIVIAYFGDDALGRYKALRDTGHSIGLVLSDFHMNVLRRQPEGTTLKTKGAKILSGIQLADEIIKIDANQKFCLVSRGMTPAIRAEARMHGIGLSLYKHSPDRAEYADYLASIRCYLARPANDNIACGCQPTSVPTVPTL